MLFFIMSEAHKQQTLITWEQLDDNICVTWDQIDRPDPHLMSNYFWVIDKGPSTPNLLFRLIFCKSKWAVPSPQIIINWSINKAAETPNDYYLPENDHTEKDAKAKEKRWCQANEILCRWEANFQQPVFLRATRGEHNFNLFVWLVRRSITNRIKRTHLTKPISNHYLS